MAKVVLGLSLVAGTTMAATASFRAAWTEGNNQPPSGIVIEDKGQFLAGSNETHTGSLTALP
jgi:hypothetical protein